jgi:hypothetical protein
LGVPLLVLVVISGGTAWFALQGRLDISVIQIAILSAINAAVQSLLWYRAVLAEASGNPLWVSAVALPANLFAIVALLVPWTTSTTTVIAMLVALILGNVLFLIYGRQHHVGDGTVQLLSPTRSARPSAHVWFLSKSAVGQVGLAIIQSVSVVLPASMLTLLTIPTKVVGSIAASVVNAVMPRLVHQGTTSQAPARRFLRWTMLALVGIGIILVLAAALAFSSYLEAAAITALWLLGSAASAVAQRATFRFLPPSASKVTLIIIPLVVTASVLSSLSPHFTWVSILCAYSLIDSASAFLLLLALKDRPMSALMGLVTIILAVRWVLDVIAL